MSKTLITVSVLGWALLGWMVLRPSDAPTPDCPLTSVEVLIPVGDMRPNDFVLSFTHAAKPGCEQWITDMSVTPVVSRPDIHTETPVDTPSPTTDTNLTDMDVIPFVSRPGRLSDDVLVPDPGLARSATKPAILKVAAEDPIVFLQQDDFARPQIVLSYGAGATPGENHLRDGSSVEIYVEEVPEGFTLILRVGADTHRFTKEELRALVTIECSPHSPQSPPAAPTPELH